MHLISQTNEPHHEIEHVKISNTAKFQSCRPNMCGMTDIWSQCMVSSTARPPVIHVSYFQVCPISFISSGYDLLLWSVVVSPSHFSSFPFLPPSPPPVPSSIVSLFLLWRNKGSTISKLHWWHPTLSIMSSRALSALPIRRIQWWIRPGPKRPWEKNTNNNNLL